jgi:hypothetical protein
MSLVALCTKALAESYQQLTKAHDEARDVVAKDALNIHGPTFKVLEREFNKATEEYQKFVAILQKNEGKSSREWAGVDLLLIQMHAHKFDASRQYCTDLAKKITETVKFTNPMTGHEGFSFAASNCSVWLTHVLGHEKSLFSEKPVS